MFTHGFNLILPGSRLFFLLFSMAILLIACAPQKAPQVEIQVKIETAGESYSVTLPLGSTVEQAILASDLELGDLDRTDPPLYTVLTDGSTVQVIRVEEEFEIEEVIIPYESRTIRNEALTEGERRLVQAGVNGIQEITYRRVYEDNQEISRNIVKSVILQEAVPEIVMIGSQSPFAPVEFPGSIVYLAGGNAWVLSGESGERTPLITSGDLDGRVFSLSPDGEWLLFTRRGEEDTINTLWVTQLNEPYLEVDLNVENVVHFADWIPDAQLQVAYSTVEPREIAPGWQANNDLYRISFSSTGWVSDPELVVDANAGGVYGWWGTTYAYSVNGSRLAFARPDGVGLVDLETGELQKIHDAIPLQTFGDWAWVPGVSWSPDESVLFSVDHIPQTGNGNPETSQVFDVLAIPLELQTAIHLVSQSGMFAYPVPSPFMLGETEPGAYQIAYLQAIFPIQSETSQYLLMVMDRDGSNRRQLFPETGAIGLEPQKLVWAPSSTDGELEYHLAFLYQGNLWLLNTLTGDARQLTGDGLISRIDWK
jgi:hypothetical protein